MSKAASVLLGFVCLLTQVPSLVAQTTTLDAEQSTFLTLINNFRAQNGAGALTVSATLEQSSQWMSADMAAKNYFSHTDSLGRDPFTRMAQFGYAYYPEGENIAAGYSDAQDTFNQWLNACDPDGSGNCTYGHRQNMLNPSYKAIGIGRAFSGNSPYGWYWTTDFGATVDQPLNGGGSPGVPAIASFTAAPSSVSAGQPVTLSWSVSGATSVTIDNGVGDVTNANSVTITPTGTTKYTLTASNANGNSTSSVNVTVSVSAPPTAITIWSNDSYPMWYVNAGAPVELGVKFRSDIAGQVTGIRFYKISANTGVHTGSLWTSSGQLLATGTFNGETANGWQTLTFASPVTIQPNTTYVASYHTNSGVAAFGFELQDSGKDNGPLHELQAGVDGGNGVYAFSNGGQFPIQQSGGYNFWVDIVFVP